LRFKYRTTFSSTENLGLILSGISKIISYQLSIHLKDKWHELNPDISIIFLTSKWIDEVKIYNEGIFSKRNKIHYKIDTPFIKQGQGGKLSADLFTITDLDKHKDLLMAVERVSEDCEFAVPVNDIRKISVKRILEVRRNLLDEIFKGLKIISQEIGADINILKNACEAVKSEPWFIERKIGLEVLSQHNNPRKTQLVGRWEPDYLHYTAHIFDEGKPPKSVRFMTHWRAVSYSMLENPGRLSWIDRDTLKFIPRSRDDYRYAFKVDQGDVDFSYYYDTPQIRATTFYSHILDAMKKNGEKGNVLRLNY